MKAVIAGHLAIGTAVPFDDQLPNFTLTLTSGTNATLAGLRPMTNNQQPPSPFGTCDGRCIPQDRVMLSGFLTIVSRRASFINTGAHNSTDP